MTVPQTFIEGLTTVSEATGSPYFVEQFNNHFGDASKKWGASFFNSPTYKKYFAHVIIGIAASMVVSKDCRSLNVGHIYHSRREDVVRIILSQAGNAEKNSQLIVNTFFLGSTKWNPSIDHLATNINYFNENVKELGSLNLKDVNYGNYLPKFLEPSEYNDLEDLINKKEYKNLDEFDLQYHGFDISPTSTDALDETNNGITMRYLPDFQKTQKSIWRKTPYQIPEPTKMYLYMDKYSHTPTGSPAFMQYFDNFLEVFHNSPKQIAITRDFFRAILLFGKEAGHLLTKTEMSNFQDVSKTEIEVAAFVHGALLNIKDKLPEFIDIGILFIKGRIDFREWESEVNPYKMKFLLGYTKHGEPVSDLKLELEVESEEFRRSIYDMDFDHNLLHPVLVLKPKKLLRLTETVRDPIVATFHHKTLPEVSYMCKEGIRHEMTAVSVRSQADDWVTVGQADINYPYLLGDLSADFSLIPGQFENSLRRLIRRASFDVNDELRYVALYTLGYFQQKAEARLLISSVDLLEPKTRSDHDPILCIRVMNSKGYVVYINFHSPNTPRQPREFLPQSSSVRNQILNLNVVHYEGSIKVEHNYAHYDIRHNFRHTKLSTKLQKSLILYNRLMDKPGLYDSKRNTIKKLHSSIFDFQSKHRKYISSTKDLWAFLDGFSTPSLKTFVNIFNTAGNPSTYDITFRLPSRSTQILNDFVTLSVEYVGYGSNLGPIKALKTIKGMMAERNTVAGEVNIRTISVVYSKDIESAEFKMTTACEHWSCNSEDVKTLICQHTGRLKRSISSCLNDGSVNEIDKAEGIKDRYGKIIDDENEFLEEKQIIMDKNINKDPYAPGLRAHVNRLLKISHGIQSGFMVRDIIADIANKDYEALGITTGLLGTSGALGHYGLQMKTIGSNLIHEGKIVGGSVMQTAGSCLANLPFMGYTAYDAYKSFKNNDQINGYADIAMVGLDALCLADGLPLLGIAVTPVIGELAFAASTILLIAINVYSAYKVVQQLNQEIQLTTSEKIDEGFRAFLHLQPEPLISYLIKEKHSNEFIIQESLHSSNLVKNFRYYITASAADVMSNGTIVYESDNVMDLRQKVQRSYRSRAMPKDVADISYFCALDASDEEKHKYSMTWLPSFPMLTYQPRILPMLARAYPQTTFLDFYCKNSFGMEFQQHAGPNTTLFDLYDGKDVVYGHSYSPNVFRIGDGHKIITGGEKDDTFIMTGNFTLGFLVGSGGHNGLDLSSFHPDSNSRIYLSGHFLRLYSSDRKQQMIKFSDISRIDGRPNAKEYIKVNCNFSYINTKGGTSNRPDVIRINETCHYNLTIVVSGNSAVNNYAANGQFTYLCYSNGHARINLLSKNKNSTHVIVFSEKSILSVGLKFRHSESNTLYITVQTDHGMTKIRTVNDLTFAFADALILLSNSHGTVFIHSNLPIEELTNKSIQFAVQYGLSVSAYSSIDDESFTITSAHLHTFNHDKATHKVTVTRNDENHASHMMAMNNGKNLYMIEANFDKQKLHNITIYPVGLKNEITVIDLHNVSRGLAAINDLELIVEAQKWNFNDVALVLFSKANYSNSTKIYLFSIFVIDGFNKLQNNRGLVINYGESFFQFGQDCINLVPRILYVNKSIVHISPWKVERKTTIAIAKSALKLVYVRIKDTLVISNAAYAMDNTTNLITIFLEDFYSNLQKFSTMRLKFGDYTLQLREVLFERLLK